MTKEQSVTYIDRSEFLEKKYRGTLVRKNVAEKMKNTQDTKEFLVYII
jgi:hypothetical protein